MQPETIFKIIVIIYSIILHEIAHGYVAYLFNDKTAYYKNRLTLNPIPHIDIMGSIIVPGILLLTGSQFVAGWAKPVPVAEHNLVPYKLGSFCVSFAGVFVNILIATIFVFIGSHVGDVVTKNLCATIAVINLSLAIFNLIPVPPADGYRILSVFLPRNIKNQIESFLQTNFLVAMVIALFVATQIFNFVFPYFYSLVENLIFN